MTFRDIDWTNRLGDIESLLDNTDKKVWIGNFHSKQARIIKKHFGEDVTTVGLSYNPRSRDLILENVLTYYGISNITSKEEYNVEMNVRYYSDKEKWDKKVPYNFDPDTDVSIDVSTFLTPDNYISELEQLDGPRNAKQLEYYFTWLYRTKERLNES
jgi:superfamily I DNA/RNA helicase